MALYGPDSLWTGSWQDWWKRNYPTAPIPTHPVDIELAKEMRKHFFTGLPLPEFTMPKPPVPTDIPLPLYTMPTPPVRTPIATAPETEGSINQMLPNRGSSFNRQRLADSVAAKGATSFPTPKTKKGGMNWKAMMEAFAEQFVPEEGPSAAPGRPGPGRRPGSFKPTLAATGQGFPTGIHDMLRKKLMRGLS